MVEMASRMQNELFGIHDLVVAHGVSGTVNHAMNVVSKRGPTEQQGPSLLDALAGRAGRRIAEAASASLTREIEGGAEIGYSYSAWCLAGLPHRERGAGDEWLIKTDYARPSWYALEFGFGTTIASNHSLFPQAHWLGCY